MQEALAISKRIEDRLGASTTIDRLRAAFETDLKTDAPRGEADRKQRFDLAAFS